MQLGVVIGHYRAKNNGSVTTRIEGNGLAAEHSVGHPRAMYSDVSSSDHHTRMFWTATTGSPEMAKESLDNTCLDNCRRAAIVPDHSGSEA